MNVNMTKTRPQYSEHITSDLMKLMWCNVLKEIKGESVSQLDQENTTLTKAHVER